MKKSLFLKVYNFFVVPSLKRFYAASSTGAKMNVFTQKRNPITGSTEWDIQHEDYDYHQEIARSAFADMLHDTERNKKYHRALQLAIEKMHAEGKEANVLDIETNFLGFHGFTVRVPGPSHCRGGSAISVWDWRPRCTGTGLLSIMAARCGADSIVACEAFKPMADCCSKILARNGVADKITLIPKRSTELTVGEDGDMKKKANILVTEVFDTELIGEGALSTFSHAHKYLLEQDCIVVPDSAIIYAQVAYSPTLQRWNKLNDVSYDEEVILKTPQKMKDCPGSAAVHDFQLSQFPRHKFIELSEPIPVFYYDWSGRSPILMKRSVSQEFTVISPEVAQVVFMWWELNMDTEGKITLSCAPWWCHNEANHSTVRPQDTIPWRDHWMQAVYYLPKELPLRQFDEASLICNQDEYSLWFYVENENNKSEHHKRPICGCGVHMAFSRTHVAYLNDTFRSNKFLKHLTEVIKETRDPVVLDLNGSSFLGLISAVLGAKTVYILETENLQKQILTDYIKENALENKVEIISEVKDELLSEITTVVCDPNFCSALLPWENLRMAHTLFNFRNKLKEDVTIIPESCEFWAMPVEFRDLHKIRMPLGNCEGIDMSIFDELVESSRIISDAEIEAQPLWEYPSKCRGEPQKLLELDMKRLKLTYANNDVHPFKQEEDIQPVNGFVVWSEWKVGNKRFSTGSEDWPTVGELVNWYPHTRQAVKILKKTQIVDGTDKWSFQITCDMEKGQFDVSVNLVEKSEGDNVQV